VGRESDRDEEGRGGGRGGKWGIRVEWNGVGGEWRMEEGERVGWGAGRSGLGWVVVGGGGGGMVVGEGFRIIGGWRMGGGGMRERERLVGVEEGHCRWGWWRERGHAGSQPPVQSEVSFLNPFLRLRGAVA